MRCYLVKEEKDRLYFSTSAMLNTKELGLLDNPIRLKIIEMLAKESMYIREIARKLKLHEQNIYYHIKQLISANILEVVEKKEVRGTTAKKYAPKEVNFCISLGGKWNHISKLSKTTEPKQELFLKPFIREGLFNGYVVVGSPDPHGPFKARARDGHYAIDLAMWLGHYSQLDNFIVKLDVDLKPDNAEKANLIVVGGPVTNLVSAELNKHMPVSFSEKKPWGLLSEKTGKRYVDEAIGVIARVPNPFNPESTIIYLAGISFIATKVAVIALTRHTKELLRNFSGQKRWASVIAGFDLDGDGKIDSVEILE